MGLQIYKPKKLTYKLYLPYVYRQSILDKLMMNELNNKISKDTNTILSFSIWGVDFAEKFCLLALDSIKGDLIEVNKKYKVPMVLFVDQYLTTQAYQRCAWLPRRVGQVRRSADLLIRARRAPPSSASELMQHLPQSS